MGFIQKSFIDLVTAKKELADLLEVNFDELETNYQDGGARGHTHKVTLKKGNKVIKTLILKKEESNSPYLDLYKNILEPLKLNPPKIYGKVNLGEAIFLVMDFINCLPVVWDDQERLLKTLDWLIKKDLLIKQNIDTVKKVDGIALRKADKISKWIRTINDGVNLKVQDLVSTNLLDTLLRHENFLHHIIQELSEEENLTLNHNDVQLNNVLFTADGDIFVIDWSDPNIGNVCVDLAHLVGVSPDEVKQEMVDKYKIKNGFPGFDALFLKAQLLDHLGNLNYMVNMFIEGQSENVAVDDMKNRIDFILNFKY